MNNVIISGCIANEPKYTVGQEYKETMLRAIMIEEDNAIVVPLVFCDWLADRASKSLQKDMRVQIEGKMEGSTYIDETGAMRYQNYLMVSDFVCSFPANIKGNAQTISNKKFPLDVTDLEDMLLCAPKIG